MRIAKLDEIQTGIQESRIKDEITGGFLFLGLWVYFGLLTIFIFNIIT